MSRDGSAGPYSDQRGGQNHQIVYDWRQSDGPTEAIVEATAEATDSQPMELPPLQQYVDVDSLRALLAGPSSVEVAFEYEQATVTIAADGRLVVGIESHR